MKSRIIVIIIIIAAIIFIPTSIIRGEPISSSITNQDNQFDSECISINLYSDNDNDVLSPVFNKTTIAYQSLIVDGTAIKKVPANTIKSTTGIDSIFFKVQGHSLNTLKISATYSNPDHQNKFLDTVSIVITDPNGTDTTQTKKWDEAMDGISFQNILSEELYKVEIYIGCTSETILTDTDPFYIDVLFEASNGTSTTSVQNQSNEVEFSEIIEGYKGIQIDSSDNNHSFEKMDKVITLPGNPDNIDEIATIFDPQSKNDSFVNGSGQSSITINSNGSSPVYVFFHVSDPKSNFVVSVTYGNGANPESKTFTFKSDRYIGIDSNGKLMESTEIGNTLKPFKEKITIEITGTQQSASPNHAINLYILFAKQTNTSDEEDEEVGPLNLASEESVNPNNTSSENSPDINDSQNAYKSIDYRSPQSMEQTIAIIDRHSDVTQSSKHTHNWIRAGRITIWRAFDV